MRNAIIIVILILTAGCAAAPPSSTTPISPTTSLPAGEEGFPVYGNWCGPGHPPAGQHPEPVDEVDAACMRHDKCYAAKGYFSCDCDNQLMLDLMGIKERKWRGRKAVSGEEFLTFEKPIVSAIRSWFAIAACKPNSAEEVAFALPMKAVTIADTATSSVGVGAMFVLDKAYYLFQLPMLFLGKGLCAIHWVPECELIDKRIRSGQGTKVKVERK